MAKPRRERYALLKLVVGAGSVAAVMITWLGFARSSDARIEAWATQQEPTETPMPSPTERSSPVATGTDPPGAAVTPVELDFTPSAVPTPRPATETTASPTESFSVDEDPTTAPSRPSRGRTSRGS